MDTRAFLELEWASVGGDGVLDRKRQGGMNFSVHPLGKVYSFYPRNRRGDLLYYVHPNQRSKIKWQENLKIA